ncbi:MAG: hypothetical protein SGPRY_010143, partial [Prymnesium sp.]
TRETYLIDTSGPIDRHFYEREERNEKNIWRPSGTGGKPCFSASTGNEPTDPYEDPKPLFFERRERKAGVEREEWWPVGPVDDEKPQLDTEVVKPSPPPPPEHTMWVPPAVVVRGLKDGDAIDWGDREQQKEVFEGLPPQKGVSYRTPEPPGTVIVPKMVHVRKPAEEPPPHTSPSRRSSVRSEHSEVSQSHAKLHTIKSELSASMLATAAERPPSASRIRPVTCLQAEDTPTSTRANTPQTELEPPEEPPEEPGWSTRQSSEGGARGGSERSVGVSSRASAPPTPEPSDSVRDSDVEEGEVVARELPRVVEVTQQPQLTERCATPI